MKGRHHLTDFDERILLKQILNKWAVDCIHLTQENVQWRAFMYIKDGEFLRQLSNYQFLRQAAYLWR
jgi:hypothetical protein